MLKQSVLSQILPEEDLDDYIESQQPFEEQIYSANHQITLKGSVCHSIYLVVRGAIDENSTDSNTPEDEKQLHCHHNEVGAIVGIENILPQFAEKTIVYIRAERDTLCSVIELDAEPLREIITTDEDML